MPPRGWEISKEIHPTEEGATAGPNYLTIGASGGPGLHDHCHELERPPRYTIKSVPRQARERHKERIVAERQFETLKLIGEEVAEFEYRPIACKRAYRVVVLRKKLVVETGQLWLFEPDRYFFYLTNDRTTPASEIVFLSNDRCDQENLIAQLKSGVKALSMPVDSLVSNWAYMVMASLAWSLKAWAALLLPEHPRWA